MLSRYQNPAYEWRRKYPGVTLPNEICIEIFRFHLSMYKWENLLRNVDDDKNDVETINNILALGQISKQFLTIFNDWNTSNWFLPRTGIALFNLSSNVILKYFGESLFNKQKIIWDDDHPAANDYEFSYDVYIEYNASGIHFEYDGDVYVCPDDEKLVTGSCTLVDGSIIEQAAIKFDQTIGHIIDPLPKIDDIVYVLDIPILKELTIMPTLERENIRTFDDQKAYRYAGRYGFLYK